MYVIIMNNYKNLATTKRVDLYEGDNLADKIRFLFPQTYNNIDLSECIVSLNYTDLSGEECSYVLEKDEELYKERLSYHLPINNKITEFYGDIVYYISFSLKDNTENILFHTENHTIEILPRKDSIAPGEIIAPDSARKILKEVYELKENVEEYVEEIKDNIKNLEVKDVVKYVEQTLTEEEKAQARKNIDAISIDEIPEVEIPDPVQSDWNQNDETASDYVKNRTHYSYEGQVPDEVIYENNIKFSTERGFAWTENEINGKIILSSDTYYFVQINDTIVYLKSGEKVQLSGQDLENVGEYVFIRTSMDITSSGSVNIENHSSAIGSYTGYDNNPEVYLKISTAKTDNIVVPLEDKFVPDTILRFEVEETLELPDVEMTVTDDGNGNVIVETYGIDIADDGNGNISITSEYMTVIDDGAGNVIINV